MKFLANKYVLIVIAIIIVLLSIYFYGKHKGKRSAEGPQVDYPQGGNAIPAGWNPTPMAKELRDSMSGLFTLSGSKDAVWKNYLALPTDEMFIAVYNAFNQLYFSEGKGTLSDWIRDEVYYDYFSNTKSDLLSRLMRLNLQ